MNNKWEKDNIKKKYDSLKNKLVKMIINIIIMLMKH